MKVRCINNKYHTSTLDLTIGKTYEVVQETPDYYSIENDVGFTQYYSKYRFKVVDDSKKSDTEETIQEKMEEIASISELPKPLNILDEETSDRLKEQYSPIAFNEDLIKPKRYNRGSMEVWDAWTALDLGPFEANILKYICRFRDKGGIKDLEKAKIYLEKLIEIESQK